MGVYYRFAGCSRSARSLLYVLYCLGGLAAFGFTLTLPGLAGFALSIGMAVDANVLIFERMREELAPGSPSGVRSMRDSRHAMSAIVDSNVTTALTALILYLVGTESVQGFAITLLIGLVASMVTAVFVTRTFFLDLGEAAARHRRRSSTSQHPAVRERATTTSSACGDGRMALTAAFIVPGLIMLARKGVSYSIEFTGGAMMHVQHRGAGRRRRGCGRRSSAAA